LIGREDDVDITRRAFVTVSGNCVSADDDKADVCIGQRDE
jgi:hypothetical protein